MTMKKYKLLYAAVVALFTACTNEQAVTDAGPQPLRLTVTQTSQQQGGAVTRAVNEPYYTADTGFDGDETVRVFFRDNAADYTVDAPDDSHRSTLYGSRLAYPGNVHEGTEALYAVYPSTSTQSHTVAYDQQTVEAYKLSDLMYATDEVDLAENRLTTVHHLSFQHEMVKLRVNVTKSPDVAAITKVEVKNVKRTIAVSTTATELTQGDLSSDAGNDNILVFEGEQTTTETQSYVVLFPAQAWDEQPFLAVTADGLTVNYLLTRARNEWQNGHIYTINIDVDIAKLGAYVTIADWQEDGTIVQRPYNQLYIEPIAAQTYTGSPVEPALDVTYNGMPLTLGTDYVVEFEDNITAGTATVYVAGINDYKGLTATATFVIQ